MISNISTGLKRVASCSSIAILALATSLAIADTAPVTAPASTQPTTTRPAITFGPVTAVINSDQVSRDEFQFAL
ncbi:MAG: hypothetical protein WCI73_03350, partial [Phycisphaerae bacterium]